MENMDNSTDSVSLGVSLLVSSPNGTQQTMPLFPETLARFMLWRTWPPCILLLGGFGNVATIFVMRRVKNQNSSSQCAILTALAVSDLVLLFLGALRSWIAYVFLVEVRNLHTVVCKLHHWLVYSSNTVSAWLVTGVTVQRAMAIRWPHKIRVMCSARTTWAAVAGVVFVACALHLHLAVGVEVRAGSKCDFVSAGYKYFYTVWHWVDLCLSSVLPSICLLICDVILTLTLFRSSSATAVVAQTTSNALSEHASDSRRKMASKTTVMILVLSCTFLVLTLPACIMLIWYDVIYYLSVSTSPASRARIELALSVALLLWYTNSAVNFLLYCFTGTRFRREFLGWIGCRPRA